MPPEMTFRLAIVLNLDPAYVLADLDRQLTSRARLDWWNRRD